MQEQLARVLPRFVCIIYTNAHMGTFRRLSQLLFREHPSAHTGPSKTLVVGILVPRDRRIVFVHPSGHGGTPDYSDDRCYQPSKPVVPIRSNSDCFFACKKKKGKKLVPFFLVFFLFSDTTWLIFKLVDSGIEDEIWTGPKVRREDLTVSAFHLLFSVICVFSFKILRVHENIRYRICKK